jgi:hypothetical protein
MCYLGMSEVGSSTPTEVWWSYPTERHPTLGTARDDLQPRSKPPVWNKRLSFRVGNSPQIPSVSLYCSGYTRGKQMNSQHS